MMNYKNAFTMIELVFVIVVLGILAAVAIPRLAVTRTDAQLVKAKSTVSAIRSAIISERQTRLFRGESNFISRLDAGVTTGSEGVTIFDSNGSNNLLQYGITTKTGNGGWLKASGTTYTFTVKGVANTFTYNSAAGTLLCTSGAYCGKLTN